MPYIVAKTDGSAQNAITLAHEFGHFTAFHTVPMPYPLLDSGSLDLEETHSQGLQILFTERADSLFKHQILQCDAFALCSIGWLCFR